MGHDELSAEQLPSGGAGPGRAELVEAAFEGTDALVLVIGADGRCLLANTAMTRSTGWTEQDLRSRPFWDVFVAPEDVANAQHAWHLSITEGLAFPQEGDWLDVRGGRRRISMQNTVLRDASGGPYAVVTVGVDVTERRRQEALLRQRAETDDLTALANRGALLTVLTAALADPAGGGCGVLFCDLDGLKAANDRHGHHTGDLLLVEVARRLREVAGVEDLVARFGGDEFAVACPGADEERMARLAAAVQEQVGRPVLTPAGTIPVGVSVGTAVGGAGADPDQVLRTADARMYRAKTARRHVRTPPHGPGQG